MTIRKNVIKSRYVHSLKNYFSCILAIKGFRLYSKAIHSCSVLRSVTSLNSLDRNQTSLNLLKIEFLTNKGIHVIVAASTTPH